MPSSNRLERLERPFLYDRSADENRRYNHRAWLSVNACLEVNGKFPTNGLHVIVIIMVLILVAAFLVSSRLLRSALVEAMKRNPERNPELAAMQMSTAVPGLDLQTVAQPITGSASVSYLASVDPVTAGVDIILLIASSSPNSVPFHLLYFMISFDFSKYV
jgi:hypothetical protein